jgi:hypothetical protein
MAGLGYHVRSNAKGAVIIEGVDGKEVDYAEFVSLATYFSVWKRDFPHLKISRPVEDICPYCFAFTNRHRYLSNRAFGRLDTGNDVGDDNEEDNDDEGNMMEMEYEDCMEKLIEEFPSLTMDDVPVVDIDMELPEAAGTPAEEERELLLLEVGLHVRMYRAQRALYQEKVDLAIADAKAGVEFHHRQYTFVVDYGQNMELPVYNKEQPGVTYYFSPLSIYNLGMVNHAHEYANGEVKEHMYAHVYHEGVGKKGANNVASLIVKTLRQLNLLRDDSAGGELNIIFDNCSGQNKNNTVLKLAVWIKAMGYFKSVNFIFLVVGHTKNAADRLFNSLKHEYRKDNIFTMEKLLETLNVSDSVTVVPTAPDDFWDYDGLLNDMYKDISGKVKINHIFSCNSDNPLSMALDLRKSNLPEHTVDVHNVSKVRARRFNGPAEVRAHSEKHLKGVRCMGLNPYKVVEMWKNYRPNVPDEFHNDALYAEPTADEWSKVKVERGDRSEFRAAQKAKKYAAKEAVERLAFDMDAAG